MGHARGRHTHANGIRLHYLVWETALPPLVLIPGITSPAATWAFVGDRLSQFAKVYILDNRGRGLSESGADLSYTLDDYADDAADFIRGQGIAGCAIVGHSMGAHIAIRMGVRHPGLTGPMVLADPPMTGPGRSPYPFPLEFYLGQVAAAGRGEGRERARQMLPSWNDEQLALREQWLPTCHPKAVEATWKGFHDEDVWSDLPKLANRSLLLYAPDGKVVSDESAREFSTLMPDCTTARIEKAGHMIPWDAPGPFVDAIGTFLKA